MARTTRQVTICEQDKLFQPETPMPVARISYYRGNRFQRESLRHRCGHITVLILATQGNGSVHCVGYSGSLNHC